MQTSHEIAKCVSMGTVSATCSKCFGYVYLRGSFDVCSVVHMTKRLAYIMVQNTLQNEAALLSKESVCSPQKDRLITRCRVGLVGFLCHYFVGDGLPPVSDKVLPLPPLDGLVVSEAASIFQRSTVLKNSVAVSSTTTTRSI